MKRFEVVYEIIYVFHVFRENNASTFGKIYFIVFGDILEASVNVRSAISKRAKTKSDLKKRVSTDLFNAIGADQLI